MDALLSQFSGDKKQTLVMGSFVCAFFSFPFAICSFVVAGTANAGFNAVLTTILNITFVAESLYIIRNSKTPIAIGFLIGSCVMITCINLMTAVYWGQLSKCEASSFDISQYSCDNKSAYGALSAFAVFLFITQLAYTLAIITWRGDLISEAGFYEEISIPTPVDVAYDVMSYNKGNIRHSAPSADL